MTVVAAAPCSMLGGETLSVRCDAGPDAPPRPLKVCPCHPRRSPKAEPASPLPADQLLKRMIELSLYAEEKLKSG